jgi:hypothetical protein
MEAVGIVLGDEAGVELARTKSGCASSAAWNGMLELMPRMAKPLSASRALAMASLRSLPCTMSLAIIES